MEERFTSQSGKKYSLLESTQGSVQNTMLWALLLRAKPETNKKLIALEIRFSHALPKLWINPNDTIGPLRPTIIEEIMRMFKGRLFYDEIDNNTIIELFESKAEMEAGKMIIDDFEIANTTPAQLKFVGYPNLNIDIRNKASDEVCKMLRARLGEAVAYAMIIQEVWFSTTTIQNALNNLRSMKLIDYPTPQKVALTAEGVRFYKNNARKQSKSMPD